MKISAQEQLLFNKNLNLNNAKGMTNAIAAEPPVDTPETKMSALDAMAQNNITFQASSKVMQAVKNYSKKVAMAVMIGASTLVATTALPACESFVSVSNNVTVNVDTSALAALIQQMMDINQQLLEQQKINSQELAEMNGWLKQLYQAVIDGKMSAEEFYREFYEYMTLDSINQQIIIDQLVANGKTQEEANALLEQLIADVESGKITYEEAVAQIMAILNSIDGTLKDILAVVQGIRDDMNANHQEYMESKKLELTYLSNLYDQDKINGEKLNGLQASADSANVHLQRLKNDTGELLKIAQDPDKYNELMAQLAVLNDEEFQKYAEMFKLIGIDIKDAIDKYNEDNKKAQKEMINAIENFKKTYLATESAQTGVVLGMSKKLTFIEKYLSKINQDEIIAAVNGVKDAVDNNTAVLDEQVNNLNGKVDNLLAKFDVVIKNTEGLPTYYNAQQANWDKAFGILNNTNATLVDVKNGQAVTNQLIANIEGNSADLANSATYIISYLNILCQKSDEIKDAVKDIDVTGGTGMTRNEFVSAMHERDSVQAVNFKKFLADYGFDKIPGDVQTMKGLLAQLDSKIADQQGFKAQLDTIISLIQNLDLNDPAQVIYVENVINNFVQNCECNKGNNSNESINNGNNNMDDWFSKAEKPGEPMIIPTNISSIPSYLFAMDIPKNLA